MKVHKSNLLTTSLRSDWMVSGGKLRVAGLDPIKVADIINIQHKRAKAEVVQLYTIGTTTPTIVAGQAYEIQIFTPGKTEGANNVPKTYRYVAPETLSGVAATDRNLAYTALAAQINADARNFVVATANVGGSGVSMTIADDAGYFPARPATRGGASNIALTAGFVEGTHLVKTTTAVYGFGVGT
jgi:hypothetical protein